MAKTIEEAVEFLAKPEHERRSQMAEQCSVKSDQELAEDLVSFIVAADGAPLPLVIKQMTRVINDIRAGERLRLERLQ